jgi:hypothetical protein
VARLEKLLRLVSFEIFIPTNRHVQALQGERGRERKGERKRFVGKGREAPPGGVGWVEGYKNYEESAEHEDLVIVAGRADGEDRGRRERTRHQIKSPVDLKEEQCPAR